VFLQRRVGDAELLRQVAAQVVQHRVRLRDQALEHPHPVRVLQIERDAALVPVERLVEVAVALAEEVRPDRAAHVAALRRVLHLDHLGAQVAQQHGAERAGPVLLDREHRDAPERKHRRRRA
jgi:hypothetical protein